MYRDFIYLDTGRVQSVIAQLQEGLLEQVLLEKSQQTSGGLELSAKLLSALLPVGGGASVEHSRGSSRGESRVLHDYAFHVAYEALSDSSLLVLADDDSQEIAEADFVLVEGDLEIVDFEMLRRFTENYDDLNDLLDPAQSNSVKKSRKQQEPNKSIRESKVMLDIFFRNVIRASVTNSSDDTYIGPLIREYLREDIDTLIYKYGAEPEDTWTMLGQVTRLPELTNSVEGRLAELTSQDVDLSADPLSSVITVLNLFQELLASPSYPDVAVSPIAIYRESDIGLTTAVDANET